VTRVTAARNKHRGKVDERDVARILGGTRHLADTGGAEDVKHDLFAIQVKGGLRVLNDTVRAGVAAARVAAIGTNKLPVCVVVDRSGTRIQRYAVVPLEEFADYHGCTGGDDTDD